MADKRLLFIILTAIALVIVSLVVVSSFGITGFAINTQGEAITSEISGCGVLSVPNSVYSLTQDSESAGTCFNVNAENITLDCNGYTIRYSSVGGPSYGVYSTSPSTLVENCQVVSGDLNGRSGAGIYFSGADSSRAHNNNIIASEESQDAIASSNSRGIDIVGNVIEIPSSNSRGIFMENSEDSLINSNQIYSSENGESIHISSSNSIVVSENLMNSSGSFGSLLFAQGSLDLQVSGNNIFSYGSGKHGLHFVENEGSEIHDNLIKTYGEESSAMYFEGGVQEDATENTISAGGDMSYSLMVSESSNLGNFSNNNIESGGIEGAGLGVFSGSISNMFSGNNIVSSGLSSYAVVAYDSDLNIFQENHINTLEEEGYAFWLYSSDDSIISRNTINTTGPDSVGLIVDSVTGSEITGNTVVANGANSYAIEVDSNSNSNSFYSNTITTYAEGSSAIFFLTDSLDNLFGNNEVKTLGANSYSIYVWGDDNDFEVEGGILDSDIGLMIKDDISRGVWNFTNVSFTTSWPSSSTGELNKKWYLNVFAKYSDDLPASDSVVRVYDSSQVERSSFSINEDGDSLNNKIAEYKQTSSSEKVHYSNYIVSASSEEGVLNKSIDMTGNRDLYFIFQRPITEEDLGGIEEEEEEPETSSSSGGSGGGGGSSQATCEANWTCTIWSECERNTQSRECFDENQCGEDAVGIDTERACSRETGGWKMRDVLFDINLEVLDVSSEGTIMGTVGLINLGIPGKVNASLSYEVKNSKEEVIYKEDEIITMSTQMEFIKEISLPNLPDGEYTWLVDLSYEGQTEPAQTQDNFRIGEAGNFWIILLSVIVLLVAIAAAAFFIRKKMPKKMTNTEYLEKISERAPPQ